VLLRIPSTFHLRRGARASCAGAYLLLSACGGPRPEGSTAPPRPEAAPSGDLRAPEQFASIADPAERSRALFTEASRVLFHPRCLNCHPAGDAPTQRDALETHEPPVARGADDRGVPALRCASCHQDANLELARVPGAPEWRLAPRSMAWAGRSVADVCAQIKDPARNGNRTLAQVVEHAERDPLVAWGWKPGHGRTTVPGTQARFGALVKAWVETGAECPASGQEAKR
jgi:hypothetical protein